MSGPHRQTMPMADAAWLHMDRATNPMVVNGLNVLAAEPDPELVLEILQERLADRFPRFRQRVVDPLGRGPAFEDDPAFDVRDHLHRVALPAPGDRAALQELLSDLVTPPLDPGKPLWHAHLIEGYEGGAALLWRIHHSVADGIALGRVMLTVTDGGERPEIAAEAREGGGAGLLRRAAAAARDAGAAALHEGMETLAHPDHLRELAGSALSDVSTAARLISAPPDASSGLRTELTGTRRVAWTDPYPLDRVHEAARLRRVTINDVLVAALAAALRDAFGEAGGPEMPEEIHAMIPFNLRPLDRPVPVELGNDFALILLTLPVGEEASGERLRLVSSRMDEIKSSHEAPIAYGMISAIGMTPPWVEDRLIGFFTDKASLVVTNVPGPAEELSLAGVPIRGVLVWAPCSGSLGTTVSIFSYAGEITVGFMTDTAVIADPAPLVRAYERELRAYCG